MRIDQLLCLFDPVSIQGDTQMYCLWDKMRWLMWERKAGGFAGTFQEAAAREMQQIRWSGEGVFREVWAAGSTGDME